MQRFGIVAAQGEITVVRVGPVPSKKSREGFTPMKPANGKYIVGHSETGHHHVLDASNVSVMIKDKPPEGMKILRAILEAPTSLDHLRPHDTHESLLLEPGEYELRIAREFDPYEEIARLSAD